MTRNLFARNTTLDIDGMVRMIEDSDPPEADNYWLYPQHSGYLGGFRWLVSGKSGTGKTFSCLDALMGESPEDPTQRKIAFDHLYLVTSTPDQGKYKLLLKWINSLEKQREAETGEYVSMCTVITEPEDMPNLDEDVNREIINLVLIDDMIMKENQRMFADWFVRSRNKSVSMIYLTQDYYKVPLIIRRQCDYISCFRVNSGNDLALMRKELGMCTDKAVFNAMFDQATDTNNGFLFVDRRTDIPLMRYRRGFDEVWDEERGEFVPIGDLIDENAENIVG